MRSLKGLGLLVSVPLMSGCVLVLGDGSGSSVTQDENGQTFTLPAPEVTRVDPVVLSPEQATRQEQADRYTADFIYKGRPIVKTVQGYSGMLYDYLEIPPLGIDVPDVLGLLPGAPSDGIQLGLTEVEKYPELWGPVGATVFARPDFSKYVMSDTGATSVEDWVQNYQVAALPDDPNRLYAGLNILAPNRGIHARINMFKPEVAKGSMSVIQMLVACPAEGPAEEFLGVLLSVDRVNLEGDPLSMPQVRLHVEYRRTVNGKTGSFDSGGGHFDAEKGRLADVGAPLEHVSVAGGEQREHVLMLVMGLNGDWVVGYNYQYLGHFPAEQLTILQQGACRAQVYGEVYNPHPETGWVPTEMGSGQFSGAPPGYVAWARQILYFDPNYFVKEPPSDNAALWSKPYHAPCYDRAPLLIQDTAGPMMKLGGPGGKDPVCAEKMP